MPWSRSAASFALACSAVVFSACGPAGKSPSDETNGASASGGIPGGACEAGSGQGGNGTGATSGGPLTGGSGVGGAPVPDEPLSPYIVVDDFGYRPEAPKVAVIRDPVTGFDASESFEPGATYAVVDAISGERVHTGSPVSWSDGAEDPSSGDTAGWFDFSSVTTPSTYYVLDTERGVRSPVFVISAGVYRELLKHAVRTFFYQRAGHAKDEAFAGCAWADGASHLRPGQDGEARRYDAPTDATTERDVSGGWYDAGDYNKYTNWTAEYVVDLLRAYASGPRSGATTTTFPSPATACRTSWTK